MYLTHSLYIAKVKHLTDQKNVRFFVMFCIQKDICAAVAVGLIFFLSFNIGGVLGNYAMKFEIQIGGGLNFCVALPFICFTF